MPTPPEPVDPDLADLTFVLRASGSSNMTYTLSQFQLVSGFQLKDPSRLVILVYVYQDHPYAVALTPATDETFTIDQLSEFYFLDTPIDFYDFRDLQVYHQQSLITTVFSAYRDYYPPFNPAAGTRIVGDE